MQVKYYVNTAFNTKYVLSIRYKSACLTTNFEVTGSNLGTCEDNWIAS